MTLVFVVSIGKSGLTGRLGNFEAINPKCGEVVFGFYNAKLGMH
jgi:hypothetical protein